ncbi:MAG: heterodisulfide reductase-related iron-sulfur binding cluster [Desulfobacterales bacterium]|jgi:heterodisulfide reductase subunit B
MKLTVYPGCSLEGTAKDYAGSVFGICSCLDIQLEEVPDWNCCGATAAHSIDHRASIELAARTLNLAAKLPHPDMLVPCPMCFNRLKTAAWSLQRAAQNRYGLKLNDAVPKIWDLADFFATGKMLDRVAAYATKPLGGLKVVCYYGCMANRPPEITESTNHENPQSMDLIVRHLGAEAIQWPYKTDCCGASQALSRPDIVFQLVGNLLDMAQRVGALAIVVSCQMCQANLDMYQERIAAERGKRFSLPVYYFSELIGIACELKEVKKWLSRHITDPFSLLRDLKLLE